MLQSLSWLPNQHDWLKITPDPKATFFLGWQHVSIPCQVHHPVLIWVINFSHTFAMGSVTCTYILSHPEWFIRIKIFTLWWYWCINSFLFLKHSQQIQKGYYAVTGLIITFDVIFMVSNMIPWFVQSQFWWFQMYLWSSVPYSVYLTQNNADQRSVCSKIVIIAEWFINRS